MFTMSQLDFNDIKGENYTVQNTDSGDTKTVKVIKAELLYKIMHAKALELEILNKRFDSDKEITDLFTGFIAHPLLLTWYTTKSNKIKTANEDAVKQAVAEGNDVVVLEILDGIRNEGFKRPTKPAK